MQLSLINSILRKNFDFESDESGIDTPLDDNRDQMNEFVKYMQWQISCMLNTIHYTNLWLHRVVPRLKYPILQPGAGSRALAF
jgi:hypothetical protein